MSRPRMDIPPEVISRAIKARSAGASWKDVAEQLGYNQNTLRERIDPVFAAARFRAEGTHTFIRHGQRRLTPQEVARALAGRGEDTRTRQQRFMGDPLPGRSALDRMRKPEPHSKPGPYSPVRAERTYQLRGFLG